MNEREINKELNRMIRKNPKKRAPSVGEETMAQHLIAYKIPFEREVKFYSLRNWRFDFLLTGTKIAIEIEGGIWLNKGHTGGKHFEEDCIKYNSAAVLGYSVLRFSTGQVKSGEAIKFLCRIKSLNAKETT
jgi:very-short-patch-repair endonuclease